MVRSGRTVGALVVLVLGAATAHAEGVGSSTKASTGDRLSSAQTVTAVPGEGVIALGGPSLRFLPDGSRRWTTLHTVPGDNLYRVAHDAAGRLLAAWEREQLIHYFVPAENVHVTLPKPVAPPDLERGTQVDGLELLPNGRDALVYMQGTVQVTTGRNHGPAWCTLAYRVPLDGKSPARLLFRQDHGYRLHTSRFGALFAAPIDPGNQCDHRGCNIASLVAYEITDAGAVPRTVYGSPEMRLGRARLVRGSDARRVVVLLDGWPKRVELVRWRYGDARADVRTLPFPANDDKTQWLAMSNDDVVELRGLEGGIELWRHGQGADQRLASLKALRNIDLSLHGFGERADGALWLHYGDHLGFVSPGKPPLAYDLGSMLSTRTEWAGTMYVKSPEALWVGIDSRGRDFVRVSLDDAERRAKPWPGGVDPTAVAFGESVGSQTKKDPSTAQKLYAATTLRPMTGGLYSLGGPALRRLPAGAARWEPLLVLEGDSLYRATADPAGRLLATWEKDPLVHLFTPQGQHVTFPKPARPPSVKFDFYVDDLYFSRDGRDALVYMRGRIDMSWRQKSILYRIALDGRSAPRVVFEVDDAYTALMSAAGAVFVMPETPGKECSHRTCFPISAVVAYEVTDTGFTPRTLLTAAQADIAGTWTVDGSGDQRVALVFDLIKRDGQRRLNGGRSLLRWRWGDSKVDYRMLPGHSDLQPVWTIAQSMDFIELRRQYDGERGLEVHRYKLGMAEETLTLPARDRGLPPYGVGERAGGGLWVHWADDLVLIAPGKPARGFNVGNVLGRGLEWAGSHTYVPSPEALWIGLDGRGRHYARIDLGEAEKRSRPWR